MTDAVEAPIPSTPPAPPVAPTLDPAPSPLPPLKPGWKTTEAWISLLTIVLGALPSSGLTDNSPLFAKIVGMAIAALAALNYTAQRTALKRAHLALLGPPATISRLPLLATSSGVIALVMVGLFQTSCGANCQDPKNASSATCVVEGALIDCTGVSSLASAVVVVEPIVDRLLTSATQPDGTIKYAAVEPQLVDLALQYGTCVIAEIWDAYTKGTVLAGSAAPRARHVPSDFAAEFDRIRAKTAPGRKFKTHGATL